MQSPDCALCIPVSHDWRGACLFSFLVYQAFELGIEVAFNYRSAVTHHKVNLLKFPLRSNSVERTDDAFVLLKILKNSARRHSVLMLLSLSSVITSSLPFGFCAACMLS